MCLHSTSPGWINNVSFSLTIFQSSPEFKARPTLMQAFSKEKLMCFLRAGLQMSFTVALNCIMCFWNALLMRTWFLRLPWKHHKVFPVNTWLSISWSFKKKKKGERYAIIFPIIFPTLSLVVHTCTKPSGRAPGCESGLTLWPHGEITALHVFPHEFTLWKDWLENSGHSVCPLWTM